MTEIWQFLGVVLLLAAAGVLLAALVGLGRYRWVGMILVLLLAIIPLGGTSIWLWLRGLVGELSVLSVVLLVGYLVFHLSGKAVMDSRSRTALYAVVFAAGLLLYPATLGLLLHDPYRLGYGLIPVFVILGLSLLLWFSQRQQAAIVLVIVVLADRFQLMSSLNTWDYLLDPLVWIIAPFMLWRGRFHRLKHS